MNDLREKNVLILGLGATGLAMARWCARQGASVCVWDSREAPPEVAAFAKAVPGGRLFSGELTPSALEGVSLVCKSPGLSPHDERLVSLLAQAHTAQTPVCGELALFNAGLAALREQRGYSPRVIAITGTNGKTTTTALTAHLIARAGVSLAVAGNIGPTMLDSLAAVVDMQDQADAQAAADAALVAASMVEPEPEPEPELVSVTPIPVPADIEADADGSDNAPALFLPPPPIPVFSHLPAIWVLELSSFQLDGVKDFEPDAATVLNLTQDHLDWHGSMLAYAEAKARVFGPDVHSRTVRVINRDDAAVEAMVPTPVIIKAGTRGGRNKIIAPRVTRFGLNAPRAPGDFGLVTENGMAWLVRALESDDSIRRKAGEVEEIVLQRLMPADALRIQGRHNAANALAALALAAAVAVPLAPMLHGLRDYRGEPHRVEPIGYVGDIEFFDDSKGTNVGATVAALSGLGIDRAPAKLVVVLGGEGKGQDFISLAEPLRRYARGAATLGCAAAALEAVLQSAGVPFKRHETLEDATAWCFGIAEKGDAVLLSPACASFDMFRDYGHRAQVFAAAMRALAAERGEIV